MGKVNGLSRRPNWRKGMEKDNKDRTLVKVEWLRKAEVEEVLIEGVDKESKRVRSERQQYYQGSRRDEASRGKNAER